MLPQLVLGPAGEKNEGPWWPGMAAASMTYRQTSSWAPSCFHRVVVSSWEEGKKKEEEEEAGRAGGA